MTSKDNASTIASAPIRTRRLSGYVPVYPPNIKLHSHRRTCTRKDANVTTLVTAGDTEFGRGDDLDGEVRYPENAITVSRQTIRAVDRLSDRSGIEKVQESRLVDSERDVERAIGGRGEELYNRFEDQKGEHKGF